MQSCRLKVWSCRRRWASNPCGGECGRYCMANTIWPTLHGQHCMATTTWPTPHSQHYGQRLLGDQHCTANTICPALHRQRCMANTVWPTLHGQRYGQGAGHRRRADPRQGRRDMLLHEPVHRRPPEADAAPRAALGRQGAQFRQCMGSLGFRVQCSGFRV